MSYKPHVIISKAIEKRTIYEKLYPEQTELIRERSNPEREYDSFIQALEDEIAE